MTTSSHIPSGERRVGLSKGAKRVIWIIVAIIVLVALTLGTKVVSNDTPAAQGRGSFDPQSYASEHFPEVRSWIIEHAVDGKQLANAIAADPAAAASEHAQTGTGTPVYSVKFTGKVGEGSSTIYDVKVDDLPSSLTVRIQTGPAVNGTDLRDATGTMPFPDFVNQIDYQNAAAALNDQLKEQVFASIDAQNLKGKTVTVTGAFSAVNPKVWLVTPVEIEVQ